MASFVRPFSRRQFVDMAQRLPERPRTIPSTTYRFAPQGSAAREYVASERNDLAQEREARIANYEQMRQDLAMAKERREEAEHQMAVQKQLRYEQMMATAIKKIGHINPADPKAEDKWNQVFQEHPELFHTEKGLPSLTPYYEQYQRLAASAQAAKEKQQAAIDAQKQHQEEINQRHQESMDLRRELREGQISAEDRRAKERAEDKRDARLELAKGKYETATEKANDAKQEMTDTQAEIDRLKAKGSLSEEDKYHLDRMAVSLNKWKQKMTENQAIAKGFEKQFPELNPNYVPPEEKAGFMGLGDKAEAKASPVATDTAQPDVPAIRKTAPVSGGTATPSGDMVPLGTDANTTAATPTPAPASEKAGVRTYDKSDVGKWLDSLSQEQRDSVRDSYISGPGKDDLQGDKYYQWAADQLNAGRPLMPSSVVGATNGMAAPATPGEWDTLTEQMHRTNSALDKAHQRRNAAMDTLAKMGPGEYLNPFSTAMDDATKALQSANEEIDKHDAAYKDFFDKRGALIKPAVTPAEPAVAEAAPVAVPDQAVAPHPYEGKRVKQKSTGQYGTFVNGQFVPEEQEAMADQPTPELAPE